jgi:hypothetical protein
MIHYFNLAEEEGFEPSVQVSSHGHLATPRVQLNYTAKTNKTIEQTGTL